MNNTERMPLITIKELCAMLKKSRVTIWRWLKDGDLPTPITIKGKVIGWRPCDIDKWMDDNVANQDQQLVDPSNYK